MLYKGRIDLVLANPVSSQYEAIGHGLDPTQIESIYTVPELTLRLEIATGHQTDPIVVTKLSEGLIALKTNGTYQKIMQTIKTPFSFLQRKINELRKKLKECKNIIKLKCVSTFLYPAVSD